jgi:hypothetical protein
MIKDFRYDKLDTLGYFKTLKVFKKEVVSQVLLYLIQKLDEYLKSNEPKNQTCPAIARTLQAIVECLDFNGWLKEVLLNSYCQHPKIFKPQDDEFSTDIFELIDPDFIKLVKKFHESCYTL